MDPADFHFDRVVRRILGDPGDTIDYFYMPVEPTEENGNAVVRQFDQTEQNGGNATGMVMVGNPTVLVGD